MRASPGASDTARLRARARRALAFLVVGLAPVLCGCAHAAPRHPPARPPPPPRVLVVALEKIAFRSSAWVELHAWLAAYARASGAPPLGDADLDGAAKGYARALEHDERDAQLGRTTDALRACEEERCARAAVSGSPFATPYLAALPGFLERHWAARAASTRVAVEAARAALPEELEPLVDKLAKDLAVEWSVPPPQVELVTDAPSPGLQAPIRMLMSAHGACFKRARAEPESVHDARVTDCVLAYAAIRLQTGSALATALARELTARGLGAELERAWTALVVHAVATVMTGWETKHVSALRQSAAAVMPEIMRWLAREWPARMRGGSVDDLARSYAALLASESEHANR